MNMSKGRPKKELTVEEIIEATKKVLERYGYIQFTKIADELDVSYPTFLREKNRLGLDPKSIELTPRIEDFENPDWSDDDFINIMSKTDKQTPKTVGYNAFKFKFDESIIILPIGDTHIGAETTEHLELAKLVKKIKETPNVKVILLGDYIDNFGKHSPGGGIHQQVMTITRQKKTTEWICEKLKGKILGVIQGDHEEFSYSSDGFDFGKYLANKSEGVYLGLKGVLELQVGENLYTIYCDHRERWNSSDNICHGLKKTARKFVEADIYLGAHNHIPNSEWALERGEMKFFLKVSPWKRPDRFIEKVKTPESPILSQCIVLLAEKVDNIWDGIVPFISLEKALRFL